MEQNALVGKQLVSPAYEWRLAPSHREGVRGRGSILLSSCTMLRYALTCTHPPKTRFAKKLRKDQTPGEIILWKALRALRFHGMKFRRQVPIGPYIVDFLCVSKKLIIEIDGDAHFEPGAKEKDEHREKFLRKQGFSVIRILNSEVVCDRESALTKIARVLGYTE